MSESRNILLHSDWLINIVFLRTVLHYFSFSTTTTTTKTQQKRWQWRLFIHECVAIFSQIVDSSPQTQYKASLGLHVNWKWRRIEHLLFFHIIKPRKQISRQWHIFHPRQRFRRFLPFNFLYIRIISTINLFCPICELEKSRYCFFITLLEVQKRNEKRQKLVKAIIVKDFVADCKSIPDSPSQIFYFICFTQHINRVGREIVFFLVYSLRRAMHRKNRMHPNYHHRPPYRGCYWTCSRLLIEIITFQLLCTTFQLEKPRNCVLLDRFW